VGFAACHGEWICLLDSDDAWSPEKVERVVETARACPGATLIYHRVRFVLEDLRPTERLFPAGVFRGDISGRVVRGGGWWAAAPTSGLCLSRHALRQIGRVPEKDFRICADAYLYCLAPFLGPVCGMMDCLCQYRHHEDNYFSGTLSRKLDSVNAKLRWRQQFFRTVIARANSRLEKLRPGVVLDLRRHWDYQLYSYYLGMAGHSSALRLSWETLRLPGQPSVPARLKAAGGLLLHGPRPRLR
jgi:glycosyltransferase involved in cell wall biosynthesis